MSEPSLTEPAEVDPTPEAAAPASTEAPPAEPSVPATEADDLVSQTAEPETAEPDIAEPETAEPDIAEPETAEPETAEPEIAEPEAAEPVESEAAPAEPVAETSPTRPPKIGQSAPAGTVPAAAVEPSDVATATAPPRGGVVVGRVVEVTIAAVHPDEVEVRLADGRIGVVPRSEFTESPLALGSTVAAALLAREDPKQRAVLSVAWARKQQAWERIEAAQEAREPVTGTVTKAVKGGHVVDVGLRAFLPTSLVGDAAAGEPSSLVGRDIEVLVMEADRGADRIVVSVRDLERRRRRAQEKELFRSLEAGARASGTVVSIADYGAVVDLGGVRGLIHRSELTWGRLESVDSVVQVGDAVEVVVLDVNRSKRRIGLSLRATAPDPFDSTEVGSIESATVVRVVDYGVFAKLDSNGAEGLVHISELSDVPGYRPDQLVTPGEQVMVKVLKVDRSKRRLSLSVRRVLVDD